MSEEAMSKKKEHNTLTEYIEYIIVLVFVRIFSLIPYRLASDIGGFIGRLGYLIDSRHRLIALKNLSMAFPEKDSKNIALIAKMSFKNLGRSAAEFIHIASHSPDTVYKILNKSVTVEGRDNIDNAIKKGRGVLYLTAHFGNWELLGIVLTTNGCTLNVIARPLDNRRVDNIITSLRSVTGANVLPKKGVLRDMLKCLKRGEGIGILLDQNSSINEGVFVDFFGQPAATNRGLALIAMKSGASVVPTFIIREDTYKHRVTYLPEIELIRSEEKDNDVISNTQMFTTAIEAFARLYPEQWFWVHRRWKTRP